MLQTDRQTTDDRHTTDRRQTDGRPMTYSERERSRSLKIGLWLKSLAQSGFYFEVCEAEEFSKLIFYNLARNVFFLYILRSLS